MKEHEHTADTTPTPADPCERREPLPEQQPKPAADDPGAPERVRALIESPGYRQADRDPEFLKLEATRGVRLQIDYLKAELLLEGQGIEEAIVVFGGTRIVEPLAAERRIAKLEDELRRGDAGRDARGSATQGAVADADREADVARRLAVAERVLAKSHYYDVARELGRIVGGCSVRSSSRLVLVTGGGPGVMEAANRGVYDVGGKSIGLNIALPREQYPNPYITPDLCFRFHYFAIRKLHFLLRARALVAFPGGYGTLDEMFETLTLVQTRTIDPVPVVLVGERYWRRAIDFDFLVDEGVIEVEDRALFWYAETAEDVWRTIVEWHENNGTPLLGGAANACR
jgi:uncharacterized protein (TIGR00730 family)